MKQFVTILLVLMLIFFTVAGATGYSRDPKAMNENAQSVVLLAVYDLSNHLISQGSGFVAYTDEYILTNCHVIEDAYVIVAYTDTGDALWISRVLCADSGRDLAVLLFDEPSGLTPLSLSETGEFTRSAPAVAIGSPIGFRNSVSVGSISSAEEDEYNGYIQFSAPVSSGSSGGPLFDDDGQVIGIVNAIYRDSDPSQNLNFAINISYAKELYEAHKNDQPVELLDWKSIDIKTEIQRPISKDKTEAREFTIKNYSGYSISSVYLYPDGAKTWGKARNTNGWLYKNSEISFMVTDEEVEKDTLWTLNLSFYYKEQSYHLEWPGMDLNQILGRTVVVKAVDYNTITLEIE